MSNEAQQRIISKMLPGNVFDQAAKTQRALREVVNREVVIPQLSGIITDLGLVNAGTIVMGNGLPLGAGFTGMIRFADALEWPVGSGKYWTDIAFNTDVMTFGVSALDGKLYVLGGDAQFGAGFVDYTSGILPFRQRAILNIGNYVARFGLIDVNNINANHTTPAFGMLVADEVSQTNKIQNGDFELGALTNWTTTVTGDGAVTLETADSKYGKYYAKLLSTTGNAKIVSDKFAISNNAILSGKYRSASFNSRIYVNYYDATPTLLITQTILPLRDKSGSEQWLSFHVPLLKYPGATQVGIEINNSVGAGNAFSVDDLEYIEWATGSKSILLRADEGPAYNTGLQENVLHYGDEAAYKILSATTTATDMYSGTLKAGSIGAYGKTVINIWYAVSNTGATAITATVIVKLGGTTLFTRTTSSTTTTTPRYTIEHVEIVITNAGATNAQIVEGQVIANNAVTAATTFGAATDVMGVNKTTLDTTADQDLVVNVQLNTATNSKFELLSVDVIGPYQHNS